MEYICENKWKRTGAWHMRDEKCCEKAQKYACPVFDKNWLQILQDFVHISAQKSTKKK